jgi:hypothetical protein
MTHGWFVGGFTPTSLSTTACEVAYKQYMTGSKEARHIHRVAAEVTLIVAGRVKMNGTAFVAGDIILLEPGEPADFEALEDTVTVVVKVPGALDDKYLV